VRAEAALAAAGFADSWELTAAFADVAQLVEHSLGKGEVTSSILVIGSRNSVREWIAE
jgi:hypothetical protein